MCLPFGQAFWRLPELCFSHAPLFSNTRGEGQCRRQTHFAACAACCKNFMAGACRFPCSLPKKGLTGYGLCGYIASRHAHPQGPFAAMIIMLSFAVLFPGKTVFNHAQQPAFLQTQKTKAGRAARTCASSTIRLANHTAGDLILALILNHRRHDITANSFSHRGIRLGRKYGESWKIRPF